MPLTRYPWPLRLPIVGRPGRGLRAGPEHLQATEMHLSIHRLFAAAGESVGHVVPRAWSIVIRVAGDSDSRRG